MNEMNQDKPGSVSSGERVRNPKQAIAIGLFET
jgi:hypothetical protein